MHGVFTYVPRFKFHASSAEPAVCEGSARGTHDVGAVEHRAFLPRTSERL
jgi:hypothetical protein